MLKSIKIGALIFFATLFISGCVGEMWPRTIGTATDFSQEVTQIHNIAVMLPLKSKGELASTSQAIHNGILAAYYATQQQSNINIKVIDTSGGNVNVLYQQAVADGADIVIGPLTRQEVESIIHVDKLLVPTIALNTLDNYKHNVRHNLYQFGLLPQDEAIQVAEKMTQNQFKHVAVIAPEGAWGDKVVNAFESEYESSSGQVVATLRYNFGGNLADQICNFLAYDATKLCVIQPRKNKKPKDPKEPDEIMRRQDIDAIFLVATTPDKARQIVPLLKFYYASDLPIYSISTVYSGISKPDLDQDIDDVYFCDMPWILKDVNSFNPNLQSIYKQITTTSLWADSFAKYGKFYALGIDAYNLAVGLDALLKAPQVGIEGASGTLYLDNFKHIYRKLRWAKMSEGIVKS